MFLYLNVPPGKAITLFAENLADDEDFGTASANFNSDRFRFNRVVQQANRVLAPANASLAFPLMFNQFHCRDCSGWEYWAHPSPLVLRHALLVAVSLGEPLHLHRTLLDDMNRFAADTGIAFKHGVAAPVATPCFEGFKYTNRDLERGDYVVLTDVVLPADAPAAIQSRR